jgi:hypothetical protein
MFAESIARAYGDINVMEKVIFIDLLVTPTTNLEDDIKVVLL